MNLIKFLKQYQADIILTLAIVLISIMAFNLGKISATKQQHTPLTITEPVNPGISDENGQARAETEVVASKASKSKLYHFPWCASGSKISDKNKVTFATEAAAISAGYTLAGNCKK